MLYIEIIINFLKRGSTRFPLLSILFLSDIRALKQRERQVIVSFPPSRLANNSHAPLLTTNPQPHSSLPSYTPSHSSPTNDLELEILPYFVNTPRHSSTYHTPLHSTPPNPLKKNSLERRTPLSQNTSNPPTNYFTISHLSFPIL